VFYNNNVRLATVFVFKNDGTIPWKRDRSELAKIEFKKRFGRQLKGCENGSAKEINRMMRTLEIRLKKEGKNCQSLIAGHCDVCQGHHRCPNRENPPCRKKGLTSLEATGIDVYKLLKKLDIPYEYPALTELTQVTMLLLKEGNYA
jgi:predicted metal-binding protein